MPGNLKFNDKCDYCYVITNGFAARMLIDSGFFFEMSKRGYSGAVLSPAGREEFFQKSSIKQNFKIYTIANAKEKNLIQSILGRARQYFTKNFKKNPVLWSVHLRTIHGLNGGKVDRALAYIFLVMNEVLTRLKFLQLALIKYDRESARNKDVSAILQSLKPKVVVSVFPTNYLEGTVLLEAGRLGISTIGHIQSWDNITSTPSSWLAVPDKFIAWGPIMTEELQVEFEVAPQNIISVGVPHFDRHIREWTQIGTASELERLGLDKDAPYLFFGMSAAYFVPTEIDVVEWLAKKIEANRFGSRMQFVVRPHPASLQGNLVNPDWLRRLESLKSNRIAINYPTLQHSIMPYCMTEDDFTRFIHLVGGASICLNSGSTVSLDAIVHDRPVVLPQFDVGSARPWWDSVKRCGDFVHQRKLAALGGVKVVKNFIELAKALDEYIANPYLDQQGRALTRERELGVCDGNATIRAVNALVELIEQS